tara:strand:- start:881 stop:1063 length:183 start_codon:yes stop_codon:yes gene_type:complete
MFELAGSMPAAAAAASGSMLDVGCSNPPDRCSMLDVGCSMLDVAAAAAGPRCWMLDPIDN